jgi:hypothetical protein
MARMTKYHAMPNHPLDIPQRYQIRVQGSIDPSWSARLGGLCIAVEHFSDRPAVTTLSGELPDQAALHGVLSALYTLGSRLLSVMTQNS